MKNKLLLTMMGIMMTFPSVARDFDYEYEGITLTYTVLSEENKTVTTKFGFTSPTTGEVPGNYVSGDLIIPAIVKDDDSTEYTVVSIGKTGFIGTPGLKSVTIPNTVTSIGKNAFFACIDLTSVTLGNSLETIDEGAFQECSGLTEIVIGNSVKTISDASFWGCKKLNSLTIGNSVTTIGQYAFQGCISLTTLDVPNSVTVLNEGCFHSCTGLESVSIGNSVRTISSYVFYGCKNLSTVTLGSAVKSIGKRTFDGCFSLTSIHIPSSLSSIGSEAFNECNLTSVYYGADNPIKSSADIFDKATYERATLYLSATGEETGRGIDPWKNFKEIKIHDFTQGIEEVYSDVDMNTPYEIYNLDGVKMGNTLEGLANGFYILRQGKSVKKIAVN